MLRSSLPLPLPPPLPLPLIPPLLPPPLSDRPEVEVVVAPESPTEAVTTAGLPEEVEAPPRSLTLVLVVPVVELAELDASPSLPVEDDDWPPAPDELPESDPEPDVLGEDLVEVVVVMAKRGRLFEADAGAAWTDDLIAAAAVEAVRSTSVIVASPSPLPVAGIDASGLMTGRDADDVDGS